MLEASGLQGRGGAGFPVGRKWRSVAERSGGRAVVLANGAEGELLSMKDRTLMAARPHLVLDGALLAAEAVGAERIALYVGQAHAAAAASLRRAIAERGGEVVRRAGVVVAPSGYVSGEATAAVRYLNQGVALPTSTPPRPFEQGVGGRPTLVQNVESLALSALVARFGDAWYREAGRAPAAGPALVTVSGPVARPGVQGLALGTTVSELVAAAGGFHAPVQAALIGGYFGSWLPSEQALALALDPSALRARGLAFGCGIVAFLPADLCGVAATADIISYMAAASARQRGPCVFGLGAITEATERLARGTPLPDDLNRISRWSAQLVGRGACRHPDGAAGLMRSALQAFADEFTVHQHGGCRHGAPLRKAA
jgi:NADH:ubiquinone oxidoreductase subunit F (NADH-binding)